MQPCPAAGSGSGARSAGPTRRHRPGRMHTAIHVTLAGRGLHGQPPRSLSNSNGSKAGKVDHQPVSKMWARVAWATIVLFVAKIDVRAREADGQRVRWFISGKGAVSGGRELGSWRLDSSCVIVLLAALRW